MTVWNLVIVLCFVLLYLALVMVYLQLRRLRNDLEARLTPSRFPEPDPATDAMRGMQKALQNVQHQIDDGFEALWNKTDAGLDPIQARLYALDRRLDRKLDSGDAHNRSNTPGTQNDAYHEAKLLLSNGVEEERVIEETGLSVEEVSLLKRLSEEGRRV